MRIRRSGGTVSTVLIMVAAGLPAVAAPALARSASPALAAPSAPAAGQAAQLAVRAPEWDAMFDRTSGWTGADGIYSIPLNGDERPGSTTPRTFFTFSDTFIGEVNGRGERVSGATLVNNTMALLDGTSPDPADIDFFWPTDADGDPVAQVVPRPQTGERTWFWPNDGVVVNNTLYLYSLRMQAGGSGVFGFEVDGISLLASDARSTPPFQRYRQTDAPLYLPKSASQGETTYGLAVLPNTRTARAPDPDGFVYVYGLRNDPNKKVVVARVPPARIADFAAYRFWTGTAWSPAISAAVPVTSHVSSEFSVSPLPDGRYIMVFTVDTLSDKVAVRYADSPVGPWSDYTVVWRATEDDISANTYTYNAKAHPHLSEDGRLLISYNVNTFDFFEHFENADIYRPRFIWLPLAD